MRIAVISDIHGNYEALRAVMQDIDRRKVDRIICLGDVVGYYPDPELCVETVRKEVAHCVAGNHDYAVVGRIDTQTFSYYAFVAMEWTKKHLSQDSKKYLNTLPLMIKLDDIFVTHSSPSHPEEWIYVFPDSEDAVFEAFNSLTHRLNFIGHTHSPSIMIQENDRVVLHPGPSLHLDIGNNYLVNVGSVGQPRDFDSRSSYVVYDMETEEIQLIRVPYDYTITQKKVLKCRLPVSLAERLQRGR